MKEDFVMRGKTAKGVTETLNFGGHKEGYGFLLTEFTLYPSLNIGNADAEMTGIITAGKTALDSDNPNFNDEGLIGTTLFAYDANDAYPASSHTVINDTFVITQDLLLTVSNTEASDINWQCRFRPVKLDTAKQALTNYRQFMIFDG